MGLVCTTAKYMTPITREWIRCDEPLCLANVIFLLLLFYPHFHPIFAERHVPLLHALRSLIRNVICDAIDNISYCSPNQYHDKQNEERDERMRHVES